MIAKEHGILFHTDAVQAFGQVPINVDECHIDMLSASGHKLNGPKGIGFLYIRKGVKLRSFVHGGAQERKRRAGTENVPGIVGYGVAAERALRTMEERTAKEIEVLRFVCEGFEYSEIAERMHISQRTVKFHISNILSKTGYANKTRLAIAVTNKNFIIPSSPEKYM